MDKGGFPERDICTKFSEWDFGWIGQIELERAENGRISELLPQPRFRDATTVALHKYGYGPFCRFRIGRKESRAGLYVLTQNDTPVYAGECGNLAKRWGPNGYGGISPRNCFVGGQQTNCRLNSAILEAAKVDARIDLWFSPIDGTTKYRRELETRLIRHIRPPWNKARLA